MTKLEQVMNHLKKHKAITSWEAIQRYRATRLADMIYVLKNRGWKFNTVTVKKDGCSYARYVLIRSAK